MTRVKEIKMNVINKDYDKLDTTDILFSKPIIFQREKEKKENNQKIPKKTPKFQSILTRGHS